MSAALKAQRNETLARMDQLCRMAMDAKRNFTAAEEKSFKELDAQVDAIDQQLSAADSSKSTMESSRSTVESLRSEILAAKASPGRNVASVVRYLALSKGNSHGAAALAERTGRNVVARALSINGGSQGGYLVSESLQRDFVALLRSRNVFLQAGPRFVEMSTAPKVDIGRVESGGSVAYLADEDDETSASVNPTFGRVSLRQHKLGASLPVSNDLLRYSSIAEQVLADDMVGAMNGTFDQACLRGDGTAGKPKGLRYLAPSAQVHAQTGTSAADVLSDLTKLESDLDDANVAAVRRALFLAPRVFRFMRNLQTSGGSYVFPEMRAPQPRVLSFAAYPTTQIPVNLGGGTESEIIACEPDQVLFGNGPMKLKLDSFAGYTDSNGVFHAALSRDQSVLHLLWSHDVGVRVPEAVSVLTGVTLGA